MLSYSACGENPYTEPEQRLDYKCDECEPIGHAITDDGQTISIYFECKCHHVAD